MRSYTSAAGLLLFSVLIGATPPAAAQPAAYRTLVDSYRMHGADEIDAVLGMSREAAAAAVDGALSKSESWSWDELRAAAMLHSQACVVALKKDHADACDLHLGLAQRLLQRTVALSPPQEDFDWRWHMVMSEVLRNLGGKKLAAELAVDTRRIWEQDIARTDYLRGLQYELKAAREGIASTVVGPAMFARSGSQAGYLAAAADLFARALKQKPELRAAALHLGRVRMLQDQGTEAASLFRSALASVDPCVRYLAALFLGSLEERDQRFDGAEHLYREAISLVPWGQSASLALAELLSRRGRDAEARQVLAQRLLHEDADILDPFWVYTAAPDEALASHFDLLRMEVWK